MTLERIEVESHVSLNDYASFASLAPQVEGLRSEAKLLVPSLRERTVWMLSSTTIGGGVAEMMPRIVALLRELGVRAEWLVMRTHDPAFFRFTKRLHNLIHGHGTVEITDTERRLYERISRDCADDLATRAAPDDIVAAHDPQPLAVGAYVKHARGTPLVWRCHIGTDEHNAATDAAWSFLRPYATACDRALFSAPDYIRDFLAGRSSVMHPTIDPLTHKNRELAPTKLVGILCNAGLLTPTQPVLTPAFAEPALRLRPDGTFAPATLPDDIGMPFRPIVAQVSRWDRLKGFEPLLDAFVRFKRMRTSRSERTQRRRQIVRLVLAGPAPHTIQDDPEAVEVLAHLSERYARLPEALQADIALLTLPMTSRKHNALMVNCLQRCSAIVVQNSLAEGFGLTATEAMWKGVPVLASRACGLKQQVRDGLDGRLVDSPNDSHALAETIDAMLAASKERQAWGRSAQRRVYDEFLIFTQVRDWLRVLASVARRPPTRQDRARSALPP